MNSWESLQSRAVSADWMILRLRDDERESHKQGNEEPGGGMAMTHRYDGRVGDT